MAVCFDVNEEEGLGDESVNPHGERHDGECEPIGHEEEIDCSLVAPRRFRDAQAFAMVGVTSPFPRENHAVDDIIKDDVQNTEDGVADVGDEDASNHVLLFLVVPADKEVAVNLAHSSSKKVRKANGLVDCAEERPVQANGKEESRIC